MYKKQKEFWTETGKYLDQMYLIVHDNKGCTIALDLLSNFWREGKIAIHKRLSWELPCYWVLFSLYYSAEIIIGLREQLKQQLK